MARGVWTRRCAPAAPAFIAMAFIAMAFIATSVPFRCDWQLNVLLAHCAAP